MSPPIWPGTIVIEHLFAVAGPDVVDRLLPPEHLADLVLEEEPRGRAAPPMPSTRTVSSAQSHPRRRFFFGFWPSGSLDDGAWTVGAWRTAGHPRSERSPPTRGARDGSSVLPAQGSAYDAGGIGRAHGVAGHLNGGVGGTEDLVPAGLVGQRSASFWSCAPGFGADDGAGWTPRRSLGVEGVLQNDNSGHLIDHRTRAARSPTGIAERALRGDRREPLVDEADRGVFRMPRARSRSPSRRSSRRCRRRSARAAARPPARSARTPR